MKREVEEIKENEALEKDEAAVCRLLADLERVDAPDNFERRVMAKIADGGPTTRRFFGLSPVIAAAIPLVLILISGTVFLLRDRSSVTPSDQPNLAEVPVRTESAVPGSDKVEQGGDEANKRTIASSTLTDRTNSSSNKTVVKGRTIKEPRNNNGGGSFVKTLRERKSMFPEGVEPKSSLPPNQNEVVTPTTHQVRDVFSWIGITADYKSGWIVRSIVPNSTASRSDARIGDVIISLDNTVLSADTVFKGKFVASSIRVRRNGQELDLPLK